MRRCSLAVIISGTRGVEGFCGSGCQVGFLVERVYEGLPKSVGVVLVHALNPYGFAWLRRVNEENVDLNRNFRDFAKPPPSSSAYDAVHDLICPKVPRGLHSRPTPRWTRPHPSISIYRIPLTPLIPKAIVRLSCCTTTLVQCM